MFRHFCGTRTALTRNCSGNYQNIICKQFESIQQKIQRETEVSREHLTPEIALHLITPKCRLFHAPITTESDKIFQNDPFWGFYWPGGQALSRYILDNPSKVAGKTVLDVGSGCGASTLAALICGAKYAVANDIDEVAGVAVLLNAKLNADKVTNVVEKCLLSAENLIGSSTLPPEEIIFLGDVFYDEEFAAILLPWLLRLRQKGRQIFVGDPGRHALSTERLSYMEKLTTYALTENSCIENNGFKFVNVWRLV